MPSRRTGPDRRSAAQRLCSLRYDVVLIALLFLLTIPAQTGEWLAGLELYTLGMRHRLRMAWAPGPTRDLARDVVLVETDEAFFRAHGGFPPRRSDLARIVTTLGSLGARVIVITLPMEFPGAQDEDPELATALRRTGRALLVSRALVESGQAVTMRHPTPTLDDAAPSGYLAIDAPRRRPVSPLRLQIYPELTGERGGWPLAVMAAALSLGRDPKLEAEGLRLGDRLIPLAPRGRLWIDFPPLPAGERFLHQDIGLSALDLLDVSALDEAEHLDLEAWIKGRIVVIGDTSEAGGDRIETPIGPLYGSEIVACAIATLLRGGPLREVPAPLVALETLFLGLVMIGLALRPFRPRERRLIGLGLTGGTFLFASLLYGYGGWILPLAYPLLALVLSLVLIDLRAWQEAVRRRRDLRRLFGTALPPEQVEALGHTGWPVEGDGDSREMTMLFAAPRDGLADSEALSPQDLCQRQHLLLGRMIEGVFRHGGTLDGYHNGGIRAFWGAPQSDPDHARHAVAAALALRPGLADCQQDFAARGWPPCSVGLTLHTGKMVVGDMGAAFRPAYTVIGPVLELGAQIGRLAGRYGVEILITGETRAAISDLVCREIDLIRMAGREGAVSLYEPLGFAGQVVPEALERLGLYHRALALYRARCWDEAAAGFAVLAGTEPERQIYRLYLDRIGRGRVDPPGPEGGGGGVGLPPEPGWGDAPDPL